MLLHGCIISLKIFLLLTVKFINVSEGGVTVLPSGQAPVCHGEELQLTCNATEPYRYLKWSFSVYNEQGVLNDYTRAVSSTDTSQQRSQIRINSTLFNFLRTSDQAMLPITTMTIDSVGNSLNGVAVGCTGMGNFEMMTVRTTINIINESYQEQPEVYTREHFGTNNAVVTLEMAATQETGVSYNVSIIPQVDVEFVDNTVVQLRVAYNVVYNVSIVRILCGQHATTTKLELNYGKCEYPLVADNSLRITGYHNPALEGATLTFSCPPGKILTGPNMTTCMKNGEWEPDPQVEGIICAANCGLPVFPRNGYGQIYLDSNTMEGARVLFICSNDVQHSLEQAHVAVCNPDGKWKPNPGNFCSGSKIMYSGTCDRVTTALVSSATVFFITSIVFVLVGFLCGRLVPGKKFSPPSSVSKHVSASNPQSSHVYEAVTSETITNYFSRQKVDLTENVAYDFVQPKTSKFVITA